FVIHDGHIKAYNWPLDFEDMHKNLLADKPSTFIYFESLVIGLPKSLVRLRYRHGDVAGYATVGDQEIGKFLSKAFRGWCCDFYNEHFDRVLRFGKESSNLLKNLVLTLDE